MNAQNETQQMTQDQSYAPTAPGIAFLGFCERALEITEGHIAFWKRNILGLSPMAVFPVFPANLRGLTLAMAFYRPQPEMPVTLTLRRKGGQDSFVVRFTMQTSYEQLDGTPGSDLTIDDGWLFATIPLDLDMAVTTPGHYEVYWTCGDKELHIGKVGLLHAATPPFTPKEIIAIKSDPLAQKWVRFMFTCNSCGTHLKAYAGLEKSAASESEGFRWSQEIREDEFVCECGQNRFSLIPLKTGLHGVLRQKTNPSTSTSFSTIRLYEQTALETFCREFTKLIDSNIDEEQVQKFIETHPIFLHIFSPKKILFKPPVLTQFVADFAILDNREELLLIEIEKPQLKLLNKNSHTTAGLNHAFSQVRYWKRVLDDQRSAALAEMGFRLEEVAKVKGIVIAGRRPDSEKARKTLRSLTADIELHTYDDLIDSVVELIKHVANV